MLIKQSRIGPAVDLDVLLLAIIHDHMKGECPREAWVFPRRITDGRLPAINNVGGAALSSSGMSATGTPLVFVCTFSYQPAASRHSHMLRASNPSALVGTVALNVSMPGSEETKSVIQTLGYLGRSVNFCCCIKCYCFFYPDGLGF